MRKSLIVLTLFVMSTLLFATVAQAADVSVTLNFPQGGEAPNYFSVYVNIDADDSVTVHLTCAMQSETDVIGSIDPMVVVFGPDGSYVASDDNSGFLNCAGHHDAVVTFTAPSTGTYRINAMDVSSEHSASSTSLSFTTSAYYSFGPSNGGDGILTISGSTVRITDASNPLAADGRLNTQPWATAFVYCASGYVDVYHLVDGVGQRIIHELWDDIYAMGDVEENTLIAESPDGTIRLYKLTSGELQLNTPMNGYFDGYEYRFTDCTQMGAGPRIEGPFVGGVA